MHPNDTLQGKLVNSEWERDDEKHLRHKIGYWRMVEERMIRAEMIAEGKNPDHMSFLFEISRRVQENHKNDPTLREQQAARRIVIAGIEVRMPNLNLTPEELDFLSEHFDGANDPVALSILGKVREAIEKETA